ncbi:MAG: DUF3090 family protein [bacterium]|nr:DUF3090 family protein [bacterium]
MEYSDVTGFAAGAIGEPGARTFLLQLTGPWGRHTYLLEKGQVAALAAGTEQLLREIDGSAAASAAAPDLVDELPRFRVSQLGLGYDELSELVTLTIESDADGDDDDVWYRMDVEHLMAATKQGAAAVVGGRPDCPNCGLAMDPDGHACPTANGDLRNHRP